MTKPAIPNRTGIKRLFTCERCGAEVQEAYEATPEHCGITMKIGPALFDNMQDPGQNKYHMLKVLSPTQGPVNWQVPGEPDDVYELWILRAGGRRTGEFLGTLGKRMLTWEWIPPRGVGIPPGFARSGEDAAQCLILAMDGGVAATRAIRAIAEIVS